MFDCWAKLGARRTLRLLSSCVCPWQSSGKALVSLFTCEPCFPLQASVLQPAHRCIGHSSLKSHVPYSSLCTGCYESSLFLSLSLSLPSLCKVMKNRLCMAQAAVEDVAALAASLKAAQASGQAPLASALAGLLVHMGQASAATQAALLDHFSAALDLAAMDAAAPSSSLHQVQYHMV